MSSIEWTDKTWNPMVGCSRLSHGCDHCYAIGTAHRFSDVHLHYADTTGVNQADGRVDWSGVISSAPSHIVNKPLTTRRPSVWFVNSMSDLFHENVRDADLITAFSVMNLSKHHTFQVLTKRPSRMAKKSAELGLRWSDNIWAGCTVEEDKLARVRVRELLKVPATLRFVSAEPLLSALPSLDVAAIDWLIVGGESGNAKTVRPMDALWARDLRERCRSAGTPFFFKQWGAFGEDGVRRSKKKNGHLLDGQEIFEMPAVAFDRLERFGRTRSGWTRIEPRAKLTPSERFEASGVEYVAQGRPTNDDDEYVLSLLRGDEATYQNPNRRLVTEEERIAKRAAEECEARWSHLLKGAL